MTITAQTSKTGPYSGNGTTTVFSYTFEVQDEAHLVVTLADATGVETVQVLNTDYTVSGVGNANGGQITMSTAPAPTYTLTISRNVPITQEVDLENRRSVAPEVLEDAYDKLTQIAQDLSEQLGRAIKISVTEGGNPTLTLEGDVQPGTFLGFDAAGNLAQLAPASGTFISPNAAIVAVDDFTGDGTTVDFTLGGIPQSPNNLFIFLDGVMQDAANYTVSGTTLTFTTAPPLNTNIEVRRLQAVALTGGTTADLVTYSPAGSGAVNTTVEAKLREFVSVKDFGAVGDGVTDDTVAIQAALDYARSLVLQTASNVADQNFPNKGGATVFVPAGEYIISQIEIPETVSLVGAGKTSTLFTSTFDGAIIRNKVTSGDGTYDKAGIYMADFAVQGDRTKTNQTGIDTLRLFDCKMENITIYKCGKHGLHIRQAITSSFENITASNNVGAGIVLDEGVDFWDTGVANSLPANANTILNCHGFRNDAAGLLIQGRANGNTILGGSYESNYLASGDNVGFNIEVTSTTFSRNFFDGVWTEGAVQAHIYINHATAGSSTDITDWKHFGNGAAGNVDRALICDRGSVSIRNAFGHGSSYKSISGSIRPFRVDLAGGDAVVNTINPNGSLIIDGQYLEDASGNAVTSMYQEAQGRPISGINFDSTPASNDSEVLDDYEEGVWTPTLETDGTNLVSVTYDAITGGRYTKIGNLVHIQGAIRTDVVDKTAASGFVVVGGLPFTSIGNSPSENDGYSAVTVSTTSGFVTNQPCAGLIFNGSTRLHLLTRTASNGATSFMGVADVGTGANANAVQFSATYIAAQ